MRETGRATEGCFPSDPFGGLPVDGVIVADADDDDGHRMLMPFQPVHDADAAAPELDIQQSRQIGPMLIAQRFAVHSLSYRQRIRAYLLDCRVHMAHHRFLQAPDALARDFVYRTSHSYRSMVLLELRFVAVFHRLVPLAEHFLAGKSRAIVLLEPFHGLAVQGEILFGLGEAFVIVRG